MSAKEGGCYLRLSVRIIFNIDLDSLPPIKAKDNDVFPSLCSR